MHPTTDFIRIDPRDCSLSAESLPFWDGLARGVLKIPQCDDCGVNFFFPRKWCPGCWSSNVSWIEASGRGAVYSSCMVYMAFEGRSPDEVPYRVALIDLEEGVRVVGRLHPAMDDQSIGVEVRIEFDVDTSSTLPRWRVAG